MNDAQKIIAKAIEIMKESNSDNYIIDESDENKCLYRHLVNSSHWDDVTDEQQTWNGYLLFSNMEIGIGISYSPMDTIEFAQYKSY